MLLTILTCIWHFAKPPEALCFSSQHCDVYVCAVGLVVSNDFLVQMSDKL